MMEETLEYLDLQIDPKSAEIKDDKLYCIAIGLTTDFVPVEVMELNHDTFNGKEVRFRHKLPEKDVKALIGHIHETWVENEQMYFLFEIWGYREDLEAIQEKIINNEYSVSAGYKKTVDSNGIITEIYGRELSVTPFPKCTAESGCGITTIVQNENIEGIQKMANENELLEKLENTIQSALKSAEKIQSERIVELESTIELLEEKVLTSNKTITELNEKNEKLQEELTKVKKDVELNVSLEKRKRIVELQGITDEEGIKEELASLEDFSDAQLDKLEAKIKRANKVKKVQARQQPAFRKDIEQMEENDIDAMSDEEFASKLNPNLQVNPPMPQGFDAPDGKTPLINSTRFGYK